MIGRVYREEGVPQCLERGQLEAEGKILAHRFQAQSNLVRLEDGYHEIGDLPPDQEIGTRLGEETVTLRLARREGDRLVPWAAQPEVDAVSGWAMSEVTVRRKWLRKGDPPAEFGPAIGLLHATWPEWERAAYPVAVVDDDGRVLLDGESSFIYSASEGLRKARPVS